MAKIYSITVTNALDGVAWACRACAIESQQPGSACVPCPAGYYIDKETNQCQECPPNTFLSGHHIYGRDACQPCGPGGRSNKVLLLVLENNQVADLIAVQCLWLNMLYCGVGGMSKTQCWHQVQYSVTANRIVILHVYSLEILNDPRVQDAWFWLLERMSKIGKCVVFSFWVNLVT